MNLGERIKFMREVQELSLSQLATKSGLTKSYVCSIEQNKRNPSIDVIERIAKSLSVAPGWLAWGNKSDDK